jgi:hypothetical protein
MTLREKFQQTIGHLAPFSTGEQLLEVSQGSQHVRCQVVALDSLACAFTKLALTADALTGLSTEQLKRTAEKLSSRLTYLLEPISPIETDAQGCVVQMRSNPPHKESDRTSYYELLVSRSGELSLARYSRVPGEPRQMIPAHVTHEVLTRLVSDFAAVAS